MRAPTTPPPQAREINLQLSGIGAAPQLLWLTLTALRCPLPPLWQQRGATLYVHLTTGENRQNHPLTNVFRETVRSLCDLTPKALASQGLVDSLGWLVSSGVSSQAGSNFSSGVSSGVSSQVSSGVSSQVSSQVSSNVSSGVSSQVSSEASDEASSEVSSVACSNVSKEQVAVGSSSEPPMPHV